MIFARSALIALRDSGSVPFVAVMATLREWAAEARRIQDVAACSVSTSDLIDVVFPSLRKMIFVSGCFWHMHGCGRCRLPASRRSQWVKKLQRNATRHKRV